MGTCSRAEIMRWCLAIHPKGLCCLVFRVLPKLLDLPRSLLKKFQKDEHLHEHEQEMESGTELGNLPELSQDILMAIFATLEIPDLLRASSVCSSWHSAYTSLASLWQYNKNQTPCLLYTSESAGDNVACLYNLAEQRVYKLTLPDPPIRSRYIIGSSNGWLATVSEACEVHLVNPITGQQINLPSVITIEQVKPIHDNSCSTDMYEYSWRTGTEEPYTPSIFSANVLQDRLFYKAFMFSNTSTGSYFVVLIHNRFGQPHLHGSVMISGLGCHHTLAIWTASIWMHYSEEYPPLKANHAYFTDDSELWLGGYKNNRCDIGVFNMDSNSREELVSPRLWSNWPTPIWITPNLTNM
ncbi:hypothetical protein PR202_ga03571 [Eleusine coracana subsp. coracana]|uniref:F-box domain-containing protein n=1 Tax=Eleusine coracana subsp. coracana TaxID=191504 RepID=A0AAV5BMC1_ELECO|nr:hypothetical protein PR202_ga03571 [Eleusine coracana subsp. coracana]